MDEPPVRRSPASFGYRRSRPGISAFLEDIPLNTQARNPLHGITLERLLTELVDRVGWETLGREINIRCFTHDPSLASSLKFLRRTPWARAKLESYYLYIERHRARAAKEDR